jgi:hypothetical protein
MQTLPKERRPAPSAEAVALRLAIQAQKTAAGRRKVRQMRETAAAEIERLLAFLDATDCYTLNEMEADPAEPTLAQIRTAGADCDKNSDDVEPSLGWSEMEARFDWYPPNVGVDFEVEHDGTEPDADLEPSLGWTRTGAIGNCLDLEEAAHG